MRTTLPPLFLLIVALVLAVVNTAYGKDSETPPGPVQRLIQWVSTPWVDVSPGDRKENGDAAQSGAAGAEPGATEAPGGSGGGSKPGGTLGASGGSVGIDSGSGSGGRSGPASATGSPADVGDGQSVEFRDETPKGQASPTAANGGGEDHRNPPSNVIGGGNGEPEAFDRWWPMCVFMDESVSNPNQIIKGMVDMAAKCEVNLVVTPIFISNNYPRDAAQLKELSRQKCNAVEGLGQMGANRASVVTLVGDPSIPLQACNAQAASPRDVPFCAEMGFNPGAGLEERLPFTGRWGGVAGVGRTAVALVGPYGMDPATVSGAVLGQAMMALPPGNTAGNGVGGFEQGNAGAGTVEEGWTTEGCARMRASSFPNNGRWKYNPEQKIYAVRGRSSRLYDLTSDRALFRAPSQPPEGGTAGGGTPPGGGGRFGGGQSLASSPSSLDSGFFSAGSQGGGADEGHKDKGLRRGGAVGGGPGVTSLRTVGVASEVRIGGDVYSDTPGFSADEVTGFGETPAPSSSSRELAESGGASGSTSIGFDDSNKKGPLGEGGAAASGRGDGEAGLAAEGAGKSQSEAEEGELSIAGAQALDSLLDEDFFNGGKKEPPGKSEGGRTLASVEGENEKEKPESSPTAPQAKAVVSAERGTEPAESSLDKDFFERLKSMGDADRAPESNPPRSRSQASERLLRRALAR